MRSQLGGDDADGAFASLSRILDAVRAEASDRFRIDFDPTLVRGHGVLHGADLRDRLVELATGSSRGVGGTMA